MKKIIIGLLALGSLSAFGAEVCIIQMNRVGTMIACGDKPLERVEGAQNITAAKPLAEKLGEGYKIVNVANSESTILYTLIKN